jgi:TRAP-type C4-dicarboxylate transport system permease small subunit
MSSSTWKYKMLSRLQSATEFVAIVLTVAVALLVFIQVILRYVFKAPLMGIEELLLFPTIWLYMIGGVAASMKKDHISCGILTLYIHKPRSKRIFELARDAISVAISSWLAYWAFWYFMYSLKVWKVSDLVRVPMFFGESAIFIGLLFMVIYAIVDLWATASLFIQAEKILSAERREN